jgi:hypothetical protein
MKFGLLLIGLRMIFFLCFVCFECLCLLLLEVMFCFLASGFEGIASVRCHITQTT